VSADIASIDAALAKAMSDNDLQSVIRQYYDVPISSRMLPSVVLPGSAPATIYKDQVEAVVARICRYGALDGADTGSTVINILLPRGVVLVDGFTAGFQPPPGQEAEHERRRRAVVKVGGEDADSRHGLGGYHGSGSRHQPRPRLSRSRPGRRLRRRSGPAHVVQQDQHPRHPPRLTPPRAIGPTMMSAGSRLKCPSSHASRAHSVNCTLVSANWKLGRRIRPQRSKWDPREYRILHEGPILHAISRRAAAMLLSSALPRELGRAVSIATRATA
jgi:hypothetical protein